MKRINTRKKILTFSAFIGLLVIYILPIFYKGLFFAVEYNGIFIITGITTAIFIINGIIEKKSPFVFTYFQLGIMLMIMGYLVADNVSIFPDESIFEIKKYIMLYCICICSYQFFTNEKRKHMMLSALYIIGIFIALISVDYYGERKIIVLLNDTLNYLNVYGTSILADFPVTRATGVFQYTNLYATFTMVMYFIGLVIVLRNGNVVFRCFVSATMFLQIYFFVMTLSRGGYLVWGLVLVCYIIYARDMRKQIVKILIITAVPAFILLYFTYEEFAVMSIPISSMWIKTIIIFLVSFIISIFYECTDLEIKQYNQKISYKILWLIMYILFFGMILFISLRIAIHIYFGEYVTLESLSSRICYFRIWIDLMKDSPVFGYGGNAWQQLSIGYSFENYTYSRFPHSYLMKTTIETGVFGLLGMITIVLVQSKVFIRNVLLIKIQNFSITNYTLSFVTLGILLHSLMDFIFVFGYMMMIYVLLLSFLSEDKAFATKLKD